MDALKAFLKTRVGQLAVAMVVLGLMLGALLVGPQIMDMLNPSSDVPDVTRTTTSTADQDETKTEETLVDATDKYDIYESKDPFKPLIKAATPGDDADGTDGTGGTSSNALVVESIVLENGIYYANITYGGTSHKVKDGDRVGTSPYEVVSITADRVLLLYGDEATPATPGEEIIK
ncbi:MAG: hypothetical protein QMD53_00145 [Actinomycetota bacterium]|nr:hypothetical protein [Actinomycetota bacterium]